MIRSLQWRRDKASTHCTVANIMKCGDWWPLIMYFKGIKSKLKLAVYCKNQVADLCQLVSMLEPYQVSRISRTYPENSWSSLMVSFWYGFNWSEKKTKIKANRGFWIPTIERNTQRDRENNLKLEAMGFKVFRFWEHEIKKDLGNCVSQVVEFLRSSWALLNCELWDLKMGLFECILNLTSWN